MEQILIIISAILALETFTLASLIYKYAVKNEKNIFFKNQKKDYTKEKNLLRENKLKQKIGRQSIANIENMEYTNMIDIYNNRLYEKKGYFDLMNNGCLELNIYYLCCKKNEFAKNKNVEIVNKQQCIFLHKGENVFGKKEFSEIDIDDTSVSRNHFIIKIKSNIATLSDCNSTNGTFVNQNRVSKTIIITPGDVITAGNVELLFNVKVDKKYAPKKHKNF